MKVIFERVIFCFKYVLIKNVIFILIYNLKKRDRVFFVSLIFLIWNYNRFLFNNFEERF